MVWTVPYLGSGQPSKIPYGAESASWSHRSLTTRWGPVWICRLPMVWSVPPGHDWYLTLLTRPKIPSVSSRMESHGSAKALLQVPSAALPNVVLAPIRPLPSVRGVRHL